MVKTGGTFRNILIWTYERGTLQYDIIIALILAFIFLVPRSCFVSRKVDDLHTRSVGASQQTPIASQTAKTDRNAKSPE